MGALRVERLVMERYGAFSNRAISLGPGLTVVAGANEAGKSTALDALADLLWGIPHVSGRTYLFGRQALSLGARLRLPVASEDTLEVTVDVLRQAAGLSRRDTGEALETGWMAPGDDRARWRQSFGMSHADLRARGEELRKGLGDLKHLVFTARSGAGVHQILADLERTADALYKDHKNSKSVGVRTAVADFERAREQVESASATADAVEAARTSHAHAVADATAAARRVRAASQALAAAERRQRAAPHARELAVVTTRLRELAALGPCADPDQVQAADAAAEQSARAADELARLATTQDELSAERAAIVVDEPVLAAATTITALHREAEARALDAGHAAERHAEADDLTGQAVRMLTPLTPLTPVNPVDPVDPAHGGGPGLTSGELLAALRVTPDVAAQLDAVGIAVVAAEETLRQRREATRAAQRRLAATEPARDDLDPSRVAAVAEALEAIRAAGSATSALTRVAGDVADATRRREEHLAAAGVPSGVPPLAPPWEAVRQADEQRRATAAAVVQADERVLAASRLVETVREQVRAAGGSDEADPSLATHDPVADVVDALAGARAERDAAAHGLAAVALSGGPSPEAFDRLVELTRATARADALADRLVEVAGLVARRGELARTLVERQADVDDAHRGAERARTAAQLAEQAWRDLWTTLRPAPGTDEDPQEVHRHLVAARAEHAQVVAGAEHVTTLGAQADHQRQALAAALVAAGRPRPDADLEALLVAAQDVLTEADAAREGRAARAELARQHDDAVREELLAHGDHQAQLDRWRALADAAALPQGLDPTGWAYRRDRVRDAEVLLERAGRAQDEARAAAARAEVFRRAVADLAASLGQEEPKESVAQAVDVLGVLVDRLEEARAASLRAGDLDDRLEATAIALRECQGLATVADKTRAVLRRDLGVDTLDELLAAVERGRRRQVLEREAARLDELVRAADPDAEVAALVADLADADTELLAGEASHAAAQLADAEAAHRDAVEAAGEARARERDLTSGDGAALWHARATERMAQVNEVVERYLVARVQLHVLREQLDAYERAHSSPLLEFAGELLEQLTAGRYVALDVTDRPGGRGLLVVDADERRLEPDELSEGTRDQVYLALRLAGIDSLQSEREAAGAPLLPVVLDDVLMTFDDDRARCALRVMAGLALRWQIVLFTHHSHLADLADDLSLRHLTTSRLEPPDPLAGSLTPTEVRARVHTVIPGPALELTTDPADVRAWAREQGIRVGDKGRLPADVTAAYEQAHAR